MAIDYNQFKKFSVFELQRHFEAGRDAVETLRRFREVAPDAFSISLTNTLTRMQSYVESSHALTQHVIKTSAALEAEENDGKDV